VTESDAKLKALSVFEELGLMPRITGLHAQEEKVPGKSGHAYFTVFGLTRNEAYTSDNLPEHGTRAWTRRMKTPRYTVEFTPDGVVKRVESWMYDSKKREGSWEHLTYPLTGELK